MYKIAVLGDYDSIYGFAALGLDTFPEEDPEEAARKLHELAGGGYAVVYITEKLAAELSTVIEKYRERVFPAIILIRACPAIRAEAWRASESRWSRRSGRIFCFRSKAVGRKIRPPRLKSRLRRAGSPARAKE